MDKLNFKIKQIDQLLKGQKFIKAYDQFQRLLQTFDKFIKNMNNIDFQQIILSKIRDWGLIFKNYGKYQNSKLLYLKGIYLISLKESKNINKDDNKSLLEFHYAFSSNLSLIFIDQAEQTDKDGIKIHQYNEIINFFDESYKYLKQSQKILLPMIKNKKTSKNARIYCLSQYLNYICNLCQNFIIYASNQNFHDYILKSIVKIIYQVERYSLYLKNQLQKNQFKQSVEPILHKCFYWKANSFQLLGQDQESLKYFIKDYQYCKKNDKQNLSKTRQALIQLLLKRFQFNEALIYTNDSANLRQQIEKKKREFTEIFLKFQKQANTQKVENKYTQLYDNSSYRSVLKLCEIIKKNKKYKQDQYLRYLTTYYHSWSLYKLYRIDQSLKQIQFALQMVINDPLQSTQCLILKVLVYQKKQQDKEKVQKMYKQIIYKVQQKKFNEKDEKIKEINYNMNSYRKYCQIKEKFVKRVESDQFRQMEKFVQKELEQIEKIQEEQDVAKRIQQQNQIDLNNYMHNQRTQGRSYQITAGYKYEQQCKLLQIQPNEIIKQRLTKNNSIHFNDFFMFPSQQILAIIRSVQQSPEMDLRNIIITANFLQKIREQNSVNQVQKLKINLINGQYQSIQNLKSKFTPATSSTSKIYEQFLQLLHRLKYLKYLSILCLYDKQFLMNKIFNKKIQSFSSITCLKLKHCNLYDENMEGMKLAENFPLLQQLSLAHNYFEGKMLNQLERSTFLQKVNLSDNPLNDVRLRQQIKSLKFLKLRNLKQNNNNNTIIMQQQYQNFYYLLNNCRQVDFSHSSSIFIKILQRFTTQLYENQDKQKHLTKLILTDCLLKVNDLQILLQLIQYAFPNLQQIDARRLKVQNDQNGDNHMRKQCDQSKMEIQEDQNRMREVERENYNVRVKLRDEEIMEKIDEFKQKLLKKLNKKQLINILQY